MSEELKALLAERWTEAESPFELKRQPFGLTVRGGPMWAVTNGYALIALDGEGPPPSEAVAKSADSVASWLAFDAGCSMPIADLRAFCGEAEWPGEASEEECDKCDGTGEIECECICGHEHDSDCDDCDGTGKIIGDTEPTKRVGQIDGGWFDLNRVAQALDSLPGETVGVAVERRNSISSFLKIQGDGWRVYLIGVWAPETTRDAENAPSLTLPHAQAA
jgi:hypothetical protein